MKFLIDTQLALWSFFQTSRLPPRARSLLEDPQNDIIFSTVSLWEIAIKRGLGKKDFQFDPRILRQAMLDEGFQELAVLGQHAVAVDSLPPIHKDPFDRLLIAQAIVEGIILLTTDRTVAKYKGPIQRI